MLFKTRFSAVTRVCAIVTGLSFSERAIYSLNIFCDFFFSLTGRTLDTVEGKPGSLRQTAEEVVKCLGVKDYMYLHLSVDN